jgi:Putative zinc-finger
MTCPFAHQDGSYVLGALSPTERQEFEEHLVDCPECTRSVERLAGLPGLLARVDPDVVKSPQTDEPVPQTLLPTLVGQVRRSQRRRTMLTAAVSAAVAAVVVAAVSLAAGAAFDDEASTAPAPSAPSTTVALPVGQAMVPIGHASVRASVAFEGVPWGTRLDLTCSYVAGAHEYELPAQATYALVIQTRDGRTQQIATWRAIPGRTLQLSAATAANPTEIALVVVRSEDGRPVLKLAA